jgi:DNA-binding response OmpR family regulator
LLDPILLNPAPFNPIRFDPIAWLQSETPPPPPPRLSKKSNTATPHATRRILVVDDEHLIADTLTAILSENGFFAAAAYSGEEAIEVARAIEPDIVLSDVLMPRMSGVELGIRMRSEFPQTRILLFSGQASTSELMRKAQADGHDFELFPKPIHPDELIARLKAVSQ